jgi:hypothetical protein
MHRRPALLAPLCAVCFLVPSCSKPPVRDRIPFAVERDGVERWGYRDRRGETVIAPVFNLAGPFSPAGVAYVADDSGWAAIDVSGRILLRPFVFDNGPDPFSENLARFTRSGRIGFYGRNGGIVIRANWDFALPFSDERAAVCGGCRREPDGEHWTVRGGAWGFIDPNGGLVIPLRYDTAGSFHDGRADVVVEGRKRIIDRSGAFIHSEADAVRSLP